MALKAKRVYDARAADDGVRVLVMRLWPRGIRKTAVDLWLKELGADLANLRAWKAGRLDWAEMRRRYVDGLAAPAAAADLTRLETLARRRTVTVLCACVDERQCHRGILKELLAGGRATPPRRARAAHADGGRAGRARDPAPRTRSPRRRTTRRGRGESSRASARPRRRTTRRGPVGPSRGSRRRSRA